MKAHKIQTNLSETGTLLLDQLPFEPGEAVEVIVLDREKRKSQAKDYPLRNQPLSYKDPTAPVAENDWNPAE